MYDPAERLKQMNDLDESGNIIYTEDYTYNADGNMSNGLLKGVSSDFAYDSENRLIQAGSTTYEYDALNNRIWQTVNGNKTNYAYDNTSSDLSRLLISTDSNGLYYMRARYYSTDMERFINADMLKGSIKKGETLNNYAYANGNPISMVDPFGRCADETNESSESIFSEIGEFGSNLYNELNNDAIYITGYDIDFNLNAGSMGEYGALAETGEDALKGADELGELLNKVVGEAPSAEKIVWPPNDGGILGTEKNIVLEKGYQFDRYGLNTESYVAPVGTPYEMRSLAPGTEFKPYKVFEVAKPVRGEGSVIAPWFDQPGGGIQIKLNNTIQELLDSGRIIEVKK